MRFLLFIIISLSLASCLEEDKAFAEKKNNNTYVVNEISNYKLPEKLTLFGEKIPLEDDEVRERAERELYLLLQQPGQIMLYFKRSGKYFPMFDNYLKEYGMPSDIKYLSVAESALYMSNSSAGASGLWQFISATGKRYGLTINEEIDERRHPEKSTEASFNYLKDLYARFNSWIYAAAAYNMGEGGLQENINFQLSNNYFDLFLNSETSRYIFRIALIKEIMENREKYGFNIDPSENWKEVEFEIVKETQPIENLSEWAKSYGTNYKEVKLLNLWILGRKLPRPPKGKHYEIKIPAK